MTGKTGLLHNRVTGFFLPASPEMLGVAVSGGSDSLALLHILRDWQEEGGSKIYAVTVDHGLRSEAAEEAEQVAQLCSGLGIPHQTLKWQGWDGQGNLSDRARRARYRLMADWAEAQGISHIAIGHTTDDQAETFLMRLAREAGVDGLSAMAESWRQGAVTFCRPMLNVTRKELREDLQARDVQWIDDPSNEDDTYQRVRARQAMGHLADLGITARGLSTVAKHMAEVRQTLYWYVFLAARECVRFQAGDIIIDRKGYRALRPEVARRLLQMALKWINGTDYAPRGRAMDLLLESIRGGTDMTLQGCLIRVGQEQLRVSREADAAAETKTEISDIWDGRWRVIAPENAMDLKGLEIRSLGESGLPFCPDRRDSGLPATSLRASPAVWQGQEVLAAPLAGLHNGWQVELIRDEDHFFSMLLSH
ncbi:tRNA(Ile)-lysidine synthase [Roseovarius albus]|uniref:tRNA(Ile)-lysidine synthase n=1 Tax=Roseovarius albus TaxID=1247867 RepID=A0A1X6YFN7_9RHOB|nr:tRNA lysidine(34) synthetase TilS [Roseovarius albus]SLN19920.1 tRNA(Ile)-lysidine synthase [Roseovarius albus]